MTRSLRALAAVAGLLAAWACEPSGPGTLTLTVQPPVPTGAVVVRIAGSGITAIEGVGGTQTYASAASPGDSIRGIIAVTTTGAAFQMKVDVEDVRADPPRAVVVEAVDLANRRITNPAGYTVRVSR